jgi:AcrR family transcriptional regulator
LRADARRNRERLLSTATVVFSERGADASLEDIARQAGVGIGTLYRHFPTRDAMIEAVYRHEVEVLSDSASELLGRLPPDVALAEWMRRFVGYVATKRGLATALKSMMGSNTTLFDDCRQRMNDAAGELLAAGATAGAIRGDVDPADLLRGMSGICVAADQQGWQDQAQRLIALLLDGLRYGAHPST